jgi:hypothetical protein
MALEMGEQTCSRCGMSRSEWKGNDGQGYTQDHQTFCCQGCAEGSGCTCS